MADGRVDPRREIGSTRNPGSAGAARGPSGGGFLEVQWSLYTSSRSPQQLAGWYGARLGKQLVAGHQRWTAKLGGDVAPEQILDIAAPGAAGMRCDRAAHTDTRTLARLSSAVRP